MESKAMQKNLNGLMFEDASKVFFTSDTHFSHKNILKGVTSWGTRPFSSPKEHDDYLIERWNKTVPEDGVVFHLGDFCFASMTRWESIRKRLNGKIYLVLGNHDMRNISTYSKRALALFEDIAPQMLINVCGQMIYLNHFPFLCMDGVYSYNDTPTWQLFGHVHSGPDSKGRDMARLIHLFPSQYDVGVDNNDYTPVSFTKVKNIIAAQRLQRLLYKDR